MNAIVLTAFACFTVPAFACIGNGCGGPYDFRTCQSITCYSGNYIGYGCNRGNCPYVCYGTGCNGFGYGGFGLGQAMHPTFGAIQQTPKDDEGRNTSRVSVPSMVGMYGQPGLYGGWGYGAYGHGGCLGGNCGYWTGCQRGNCGGFYDFRRCSKPMCNHGPYRGYGCSLGTCQFICFRGQCHSAYGYGHGCHGMHCGMPYDIEDCFDDNCGYNYKCKNGRCDKRNKKDDEDYETPQE